MAATLEFLSAATWTWFVARTAAIDMVRPRVSLFAPGAMLTALSEHVVLRRTCPLRAVGMPTARASFAPRRT
jgi:hypothetical protein